MSAVLDRAMLEQAIAWHLRLKDANEEAWIEFAEWLDADPAHNLAYEAVADCDAQMSPLLERASFPTGEEHEQPPEVSNDDHGLQQGVRRDAPGRKAWRWGALAASIAVAGLFGGQMMLNGDARYAVETTPGEARTVSLADGSRVSLNGGTRIILDKNNTRSVEIARGEARFSVRHHDSDPFTVVVGEQRLVDIGTVFNVVRTDQQLRVGVAEGAVRFEGPGQTVNLRAGDSLAANTRGKIEISQSPVPSIGSWASGKLVYDQAPLGQVAEDLRRSTGISLELPPRMGSRSFSGVIQTDGGTEMVRARLEELLGETIVADGARWSVEVR
jgi:transmembrane sensor